MKTLALTATRQVSCNGKLWDGDESAEGDTLPATDDDVRRTINMLLTTHEQRELPPVKEKKTKAKKSSKETVVEIKRRVR